MAEVVVTPKNDGRYGHVGELIDILGEFDPNALIRAESDGSFSIVDETIQFPDNDTTIVCDVANGKEAAESVSMIRNGNMPGLVAQPINNVLSTCHSFGNDGEIITESEEEFEAQLPPNIRGTLTDMRYNNEEVVRNAAGMICDAIYTGLVNGLGQIMEYNVHAHAHMADSQLSDMCHIVDNKMAKGGKKRR